MGFDDVPEHGRVAVQTLRELVPIDGVEDAGANPARSEFFYERAKIVGGGCESTRTLRWRRVVWQQSASIVLHQVMHRAEGPSSWLFRTQRGERWHVLQIG